MTRLAGAPHWLHIGSGKAGSTSVAAYLAQHPQLFVSPVKEPRYFLSPGVRPSFRGPRDDDSVNRDLVWRPADYQSLFDARGPQQLAGELSQAYLAWPAAPLAVKAHNPEMRIIAVLRQPADRAFSAWAAHRRDGLEPLASFEEAVRAEEQRLEAGWAPTWAYVERGRYAEALGRWLGHFPAEQLRVFLYEDLRRDPLGLVRQVFEFLGVDPAFAPDMRSLHNVTVVPRSRRLGRLIEDPSRARHLLGRAVPKRWRSTVASRILHANERRLTFDPATRRELTRRLADDILQLSQLLGRDLSIWLDS